MRSFVTLLLFCVALLAKEPIASITLSGSLVDMVASDDKLYCATDASSVDVVDLSTFEVIKQIKVEKIYDFAGEMMDSKIYSVDLVDEKLLILSQDDEGYRRLHIYEGGKLRSIFDRSSELSIAKAKFVSKDLVLLADLGNEYMLLNLQSGEVKHLLQASMGRFSDFALNESKSLAVCSDESGVVRMLDLKSKKMLSFSGNVNLDNIFMLDFRSNTIAAAGQDRKLVIYSEGLATKSVMESNFLIYAVALSSNASSVAYSSDESGTVKVLDLASKKEIASLSGSKALVSKILYLDETKVAVGSDSKELLVYDIR